MSSVAVTVALVCAIVNLGVGLAGAWRWYRVAPSEALWPAVRIGQAVAAGQGIVAGVLALGGYEPRDGLFWLYALLPVLIGVLAEQLRLLAAEQVLERRGLADAQALGQRPQREQRSVVLEIVRREMGVMAAAALVVAFLSLRAAMVV
ncbi:MAG TPA: hypothetical protein VGV36_00980 [Solirubrobacteraceae bacterium]|nr:hypothetical protein [Solirubrobacteraceae bacterium]